MVRRVVLSAVVAAISVIAPITAAGAGAGSSVRITVRPSVGTPTSPFSVGFRTPASAGTFGVLEREYVITATGAGGSGCESKVSARVLHAKAHVREQVRLRPTPSSAMWCAGKFRGTIQEIEGPVCRKGQICPLFASRLMPLGRFAFRVRSVPSQTTPSGQA